MDILEFIDQTEGSYFRTHHDTGANMNALFIWNQLREFAGMPKLTKRDLIQRAIDTYRADAERARARNDDKWAKIYLDAVDKLEEEIKKY